MDSGRRDLEDFVSIADLAAGTIGDVMSSYRNAGVELSPHVVAAITESTPGKARDLGVWFSLSTRPLRRLVIAIEPGDVVSELRIRHLDLWSGAAP